MHLLLGGILYDSVLRAYKKKSEGGVCRATAHPAFARKIHLQCSGETYLAAGERGIYGLKQLLPKPGLFQSTRNLGTPSGETE